MGEEDRVPTSHLHEQDFGLGRGTRQDGTRIAISFFILRGLLQDSDRGRGLEDRGPVELLCLAGPAPASDVLSLEKDSVL